MLDQVRVLAFDIFGTTVDWWTGVSRQVDEIAAERGVELDGGAFAEAWRDRYAPSLRRVIVGEGPFATLDVLHRESLDDLLLAFGAADAFDEASRERLVRAWHRLPAWDDAVDGLSRLGRGYVVAALSNGGFALLTNLVKAAGLPFDCIISAELAGSYKPDPRVYRHAAGLLDVQPAQVLMVAAHGWDLAGAREAGMRTAFVERPVEKGPHREADRRADVDCDLAVAGFAELAEALGR
ncbi:haloacid dehalogenase type II [Solihabitans fulvus]|uniref:Haloacid dehalogenase type II n=1 Tax=Solihabitans fulvus TaxID=1892852 RepID=A0A5B2WP44_9PSEU|nr:haloacid dehalogenase type II [Solihabitans fulvus]KAA2252718.1 haloacid dehalogenase type II [Solihabitans fulvus]